MVYYYIKFTLEENKRPDFGRGTMLCVLLKQSDVILFHIDPSSASRVQHQ